MIRSPGPALIAAPSAAGAAPPRPGGRGLASEARLRRTDFFQKIGLDRSGTVGLQGAPPDVPKARECWLSAVFHRIIIHRVGRSADPSVGKPAPPNPRRTFPNCA